MIRVVLNFTAEDKEQYRKVKPVRRVFRGKGLHEFPNEAIVQLADDGFKWSEAAIKIVQLRFKILDWQMQMIKIAFYKK